MSRAPVFDASMLARFELPRRTFAAGETIFVAEDTGAEMFVVLAGRVKLTSFGSVLENVEPLGTFGEMALIDAAPRSATATAIDTTEVAVIDARAFLALVRYEPSFSLHVMQRLAGRVRRMNDSL